MNIGELAKNIARTMGKSEADTRAVISAIFAQIADTAARGEDISIPGFGKFSVKDRAAREGRNPRTGQSMKIAASRKLAFTAAKGLKDKL